MEDYIFNSSPERNKTTIPLKKPTRERLIAYGKKGETWDELANRLMDMIDKSKM